ncbi:MAG: hypothetical protein HOV87_23665 [Catenulispora sp.]|nr:hypothetical protein [Catenulispora sp.]
MSRKIPSRNHPDPAKTSTPKTSTPKTSTPKTRSAQTRSAQTKPAQSSSWIVPGILVAGTLLLIGAVADHNGTLVIVTVLLMVISVSSARGRR